MKKKDIYIGNTLLKSPKKEVEGRFVEIEGEKYYKISNFDQMPDFFISVISSSNHWMFISSNGALSAGRKSRDNAIFPYYTVDKIHDYKGKTGSSTYILAEKNSKNFLWEPFSKESEELYSIERNIFKSIYGNKIIFEEINHDLEIKFLYSWGNSERFGFIIKSKMVFGLFLLSTGIFLEHNKKSLSSIFSVFFHRISYPLKHSILWSNVVEISCPSNVLIL